MNPASGGEWVERVLERIGERAYGEDVRDVGEQCRKIRVEPHARDEGEREDHEVDHRGRRFRALDVADDANAKRGEAGAAKDQRGEQPGSVATRTWTP